MASKPTYEELEQRLKELEKETAESERAEEALRESEERYRGLFENSTDFAYTLDLKGNFMNVNQAAEHLTGYTKAELIGMNYRGYMPSHAHRRVLQAFTRIFETEKPLQDYPIEVTVKDGSKKYFESSATLLREGGEIVGCAPSVAQLQPGDSAP